MEACRNCLSPHLGRGVVFLTGSRPVSLGSAASDWRRLPHLPVINQLAERASISMGYAWDTFETYRLRQVDLEGYLRKIFGAWDFYINVRL